ncbi:hypothetical protein WA026_023377 [Henosepilachna vigintioctopunctata]|uniref:RecQ-mediated genome instability protein 1 C-terminal OB-fold domain-containing protein n=1 Tax=Henosepilachna vigintioctopunctata TaxID=420089 RepID=A0AAW1V5W9_9CUCU
MDIDHMENKDLSESRSNIISITELLRHAQQANCGSFKVHAKFKSIVEKLTLQKQEYKLTIMIQDDSNEAICKVHSEVISKWAGLTPAEIMNLKTNIFSQDIESKKKVEKVRKCLRKVISVQPRPGEVSCKQVSLYSDGEIDV